MNRRTLFCLASLFWCLAPWSTSAQADTCSNYLFPLTLRDAQGELIHGALPNELQVKLNGKVVPIESIQRENRPRRIVILLDASGSMNHGGGGHPWSEAVASASHLASLAEDRAQLALLIFNERVVEQIGFDRGNSAVVQRLMELMKDPAFVGKSVHGRTALNDAVETAFALLSEPGTADTFYIVTDGVDAASHTPRREIEQKLTSTGIRIFSLLVFPPSDLGIHGQPLNELLGIGPDFFEYASITGGASMRAAEGDVHLSFEVHRKLPAAELTRLLFQAMFDNEVLRASLPGVNIKKRELKSRARVA